MNKPHRVARYMEGFFHRYLGMIKGHSDKTILAYRDAIKLLLCFTADRCKRHIDDLTIEDLDDKLIVAFLDHLEQERHCSIRTRNARFAAISTFFNFIGREEPSLLAQCHRIRTIPCKRDQHKTVDYLDENELQTMLDCIHPTSQTGVRDKALLLFLFNTGARVQETIDLPVDHLRLDTQGQVKLIGKGRKERACPLWPETVEAVIAYLTHRRTQPSCDNRLFLNANGLPITRFGVRHIIRKYAEQAARKCPSLRQKKVGPHTMRHSTAMHLLRAGNDINMIAFWLGHADISTTHLYVEIDMEMKRQMLAKASPPTTRKTRREWQTPKTLQWLAALSRRSELCAAK